MATSVLYKALGVSGYEHQSCSRKGGTFSLQMSAPTACHKCPQCGNRDVIHRGTYSRVVSALPVGRARTQLFIDAPRLECPQCERVLHAVLPGVVPLCNHTSAITRKILYGMSWTCAR